MCCYNICNCPCVWITTNYNKYVVNIYTTTQMRVTVYKLNKENF